MRKFFPYMIAGIFVSSLSVFACTTTTTSTGDGDDDGTSSGSSGSSTDGGKTSSSGGSSTDGGKTSSSGGSSSSGGGSSSSGGSTAEFDVTSVVITPATATVGTEATHTFTLTYTGNPADADGQVLIIYGVTDAPDGVAADAQPLSGLTTEDPTEEGKLMGSFKFKAPLAGTYKIGVGFDGDQDGETADDQKIATDDIVAE